MGFFAALALLLGVRSLASARHSSPATTPCPKHVSPHVVMEAAPAITRLPMTIRNTVYVANTTNIYTRSLAAMQTPAADPDVCRRDYQFYNRTWCSYERCMRNFYQGMVVTTMYNLSGNHYWYTDTVTLTAGIPHWGTMQNGKAYFPAPLATTTTVTGSQTLTRRLPAWNTGAVGPAQPIFAYNKPPPCWNEPSCCAYCWYHGQRHNFWDWHHPLDPRTALFWLWVPTVAMSALSLLLTACYLPHVRRQRQERAEKGPQVSTETQQVTYTTPDGRTAVTSTAPAQSATYGNASQALANATAARDAGVDPALTTAAIAGAGAGTAVAATPENATTVATNKAATNGSGVATGQDTAMSTGVDNAGSVRGRGTMRGRGEDGTAGGGGARGRVQFMEQEGKPVPEKVEQETKTAGQEVVTVVEPAKNE